MRPDLMRGAVVGVLLLVFDCLTLGGAAAAAAEATGFGAAKFGMSFAAVQKLFPKARTMDNRENLGVMNIGGPYVSRLLLTDQEVPDLPHPTNVELRFWKGKLWEVDVYLGKNSREDALKALTKELGPPTSSPEDGLWVGKKTDAALRKEAYFMADRAAAGEARAWFAEILGGSVVPDSPPDSQGGTPASPSTATPQTGAATPAPATTRAATPHQR